eukprot:jgi/Chrzof1/10682/Cz05g08140.t1
MPCSNLLQNELSAAVAEHKAAETKKQSAAAKRKADAEAAQAAKIKAKYSALLQVIHNTAAPATDRMNALLSFTEISLPYEGWSHSYSGWYGPPPPGADRFEDLDFNCIILPGAYFTQIIQQCVENCGCEPRYEDETDSDYRHWEEYIEEHVDDLPKLTIAVVVSDTYDVSNSSTWPDAVQQLSAANRASNNRLADIKKGRSGSSLTTTNTSAASEQPTAKAASASVNTAADAAVQASDNALPAVAGDASYAPAVQAATDTTAAVAGAAAAAASISTACQPTVLPASATAAAAAAAAADLPFSAILSAVATSLGMDTISNQQAADSSRPDSSHALLEPRMGSDTATAVTMPPTLAEKLVAMKAAEVAALAAAAPSASLSQLLLPTPRTTEAPSPVPLTGMDLLLRHPRALIPPTMAKQPFPFNMKPAVLGSNGKTLRGAAGVCASHAEGISVMDVLDGLQHKMYEFCRHHCYPEHVGPSLYYENVWVLGGGLF